MKIQLKRSNVLESGKAKAPTAAQMEYGEIAVNYNTADPVLFIKDSANAIIRIGNYDDALADIEANIDQIEADILQIKQDIDDIEADIVVIKADIVSLKGRADSIEADIVAMKADINSLDGRVDTIEDVLPSPLTGSAHQDNTLDERYVSRFSWADLPTL